MVFIIQHMELIQVFFFSKDHKKLKMDLEEKKMGKAGPGVLWDGGGPV